MRLLTEEEMGLLEWESGTLNMAFIDDHKAEVKALNEAQRDLTHKETLKEIGRWLKKSISLDEIWTWETDIESLLRGEMPEEE